MQLNNEEKKTATSYIIEFYELVGRLNHETALYFNTMSRLEHHHPIKDGKALEFSDEDNNTVDQIVNNIRYLVYQITIKYHVFVRETKGEPDKTIIEASEKIKLDYIIKRDILNEFTLKINFFLSDKVMSDLLRNTEMLLNEISNQQNTAF